MRDAYVVKWFHNHIRIAWHSTCHWHRACSIFSVRTCTCGSQAIPQKYFIIVKVGGSKKLKWSRQMAKKKDPASNKSKRKQKNKHTLKHINTVQWDQTSGSIKKTNKTFAMIHYHAPLKFCMTHKTSCKISDSRGDAREKRMQISIDSKACHRKYKFAMPFTLKYNIPSMLNTAIGRNQEHATAITLYNFS